ncbi:HU domain-containing protein [Spirosoma rhododendri]|uniref:SPOR domain-containing protein n=1 Tax=Spirosoma rhododendri TaxID=2728024 RepID=A0A7L5DQX9_9BACT|nr:SPOR domain-containing protein [Spirosoma rhododendri]QJD80012.1 SPOR domain-containing protein [Spirosoma rhododendri]
MATVTDYLKKLLYQYDCVVVPELGAFLTHYQSASFSESTGLFLPPRKRVAFNEALRLDDGILANYIMLHEPVSREGAQRMIAQFVQSLHQTLDSSDRFDLDGIGSFTRNEEGKLQFEPGLRHNFFGEAFGMSDLPAQLVNRKPVQEPVFEAVLMPATALGPVRTLPESDAVLTPLRRSTPYWRIAASLLLIGSLGAVSYFTVIEPGAPLRSGLDPASLFRFSPTQPEVANQQQVKSEEPVVAQPVVPVAIETPVPAATPTPTPAPSVEPVAVVPTFPTASVEPVAVSAVRAKTMPTTRVKVAPRRAVRAVGDDHFTIIAGSFASKRNALRLRRQLQKAGYTDAYVIPPYTRKQLYKVAAASFEERTDAINNVDSIGQLAHTKPWIFTH